VACFKHDIGIVPDGTIEWAGLEAPDSKPHEVIGWSNTNDLSTNDFEVVFKCKVLTISSIHDLEAPVSDDENT